MRQSQKLPKCNYPKATDTSLFGLQQLPTEIQSVNWGKIEPYRSKNYSTQSFSELSPNKILETARIVANSFAENEPMQRHLKVPKKMPESIMGFVHDDTFGSSQFGEWSKSNIIYWIIRLFVLTDPSNPINEIGIHPDLKKFSMAILDVNSNVIGGAFNTIVRTKESSNRESDPFIGAAFMFNKPIFELIFPQEHEAIEALKNKYQDFKIAHENNKVGSHFLVARSPKLPSEDAFELVAASAQTFHNQGFEFMIVGAVNEWTGAACEVLNGSPVHFVPFRAEQRVPNPKTALPTERYSDDGFLSDKDSGSMFYIIKLK